MGWTSRLSLLPTLLLVAASTAVPGVVHSPAGEDPCEAVEDLVLCRGAGAGESGGEPGITDPRELEPDAFSAQQAIRPEVVRTGPGDEPEVAPHDHQEPHPGGSRYLGNNTCRYWGTRYADGDSDGDASYGADDSMGTYARATANQPFLPGTNTSTAFARAGVAIRLGEDWPQPSNITVSFPWHTRGQLDVNSDADGSAEAEHETIMLLFRGSELAAEDVVVSRAINTGFGPRTEDVVRDGETGLTVTSPGNITYHALGVNWAMGSATGATVTLTNARGTSLFFGPGLHVWLEHQDWHFDLPSGWEITACE